jgi:hypothetical protein
MHSNGGISRIPISYITTNGKHACVLRHHHSHQPPESKQETTNLEVVARGKNFPTACHSAVKRLGRLNCSACLPGRRDC